jgi:hypothetical protein
MTTSAVEGSVSTSSNVDPTSHAAVERQGREGVAGRTGRTGSLNVDIRLVELVNELGEGREVTVHCGMGKNIRICLHR